MAVYKRPRASGGIDSSGMASPLGRAPSRATNGQRNRSRLLTRHRWLRVKSAFAIRSRFRSSSQFMEQDFLPFVRTTKASKPNTIRFYENSVANLKAYSKLSGLRLDEITAEQITGFVAHRQTSKVQISTLNADLVALRRVFHLAVEWGRVSTVLPPRAHASR